jgi:hypothetical protein
MTCAVGIREVDEAECGLVFKDVGGGLRDDLLGGDEFLLLGGRNRLRAVGAATIEDV